MLDAHLTGLVIDLLGEQSERDKQISIGASNASNPCNRCLADDLTGVRQERSWAWLGAVLGTAIHEFIENKFNRSEKWRAKFGGAFSEQKVVIGEIEGYGTVKSTSDLFMPEFRTVLDWKTTKKDKLKQYVIADELNFEVNPDHYTARSYENLMAHVFTMRRYLNQAMLYGIGAQNLGYKVEYVALAFIVRGGLGSDDIKVFKYPFDPVLAQRVWDRVCLLWAYLQEGKTPEDFDSHEFCWYCTNKR